MQVIIDRFEGEYAVVEIDSGNFVNLPKILIPDAHEGDVVDIIINTEETSKRSENIQNLMDDLFED